MPAMNIAKLLHPNKTDQLKSKERNKHIRWLEMRYWTAFDEMLYMFHSLLFSFVSAANIDSLPVFTKCVSAFTRRMCSGWNDNLIPQT